MKTKIWISFKARAIPGGAATILAPAECGADVATVDDVPVLNNIFVDVKLDEQDERVGKLLAQLKKYDVTVNPSTYIEYTEEDRQNARLLRMSISDIKESFDVFLAEGTKYDMTNACANCGTGARQTSVLYIDGSKLSRVRKYRAIGSGEAHFLVDGGMVKKLKDAGVTGISFGDVRARLKNEKWTSVARDQILINHVMPPMRGEFRGDDEQQRCKVCRRGGRGGMPERPYRKKDLVGMQDFNLTWEWFGEFWPENKERGFGEKRPFPLVLVTPKVMNIFRDAGVTTFQWTPVGIEE